MKSKTLAQCALFAITLAVPGLFGCTAQAQNTPPQNSTPETSMVTLLKTPNNGIQPQAAMDKRGTLHLIYFAGKPMAGDIFYVRSTDSGQSFSTPLRVNSQPNSAIATGTIRGAQLALGKDNRVHVAWNGSGEAQPKGAGGTPMLYTRINPEGTAFEAQRNLITWAGGLDGGGSIAADGKGAVYVVWHAGEMGKGADQRAIYLARSTDDGQTFEREKKINPQSTGACECCQVRAFVDDKGTLSVLYRAAGNGVKRDTTLLYSTDNGAKFTGTMLHPWNIVMCPMSSYTATQSAKGTFAAWETEDQVFMGALPTANAEMAMPIAAPGMAKARKHPVVLANRDGQILFAWTEGTGWNRGGSLSWQIYDANGKATAQKGRAEGVPVWGLLSAVPRPDGGFILFH